MNAKVNAAFVDLEIMIIGEMECQQFKTCLMCIDEDVLCVTHTDSPKHTCFPLRNVAWYDWQPSAEQPEVTF